MDPRVLPHDALLSVDLCSETFECIHELLEDAAGLCIAASEGHVLFGSSIRQRDRLEMKGIHWSLAFTLSGLPKRELASLTCFTAGSRIFSMVLSNIPSMSALS